MTGDSALEAMLFMDGGRWGGSASYVSRDTFN
jgi:hypothetical protein